MIVIDTSVAFKWFEESEKNRKTALAILTNHLNKQEEIYVPDLFFYEITNAWSTKTALTKSDIEENLLRLQKYSLTVSPVNFSQLLKASEFSKNYHVSVYDASFAVLADEKQCDLITADARFVRQINLPRVKLLK